MVPVRPGAFTFRRESISEVRQHLRLSQAQLAQHLGVPKNTVSRWETGATTPDADSLAAIYSIAREAGVVANFFAADRTAVPDRDIVWVYWEVSSAPVLYGDTGESIIEAVERQVPHASRRVFKAFLASPHSWSRANLEGYGWRVRDRLSFTGLTNWKGRIYDEALSDACQNPARSAVFLEVSGPDYVDLVNELRDRGVVVYLLRRKNPWTVKLLVGPDLLEAAVGKHRIIEIS